MPRKREPAALKAARGKSHVAKGELEAEMAREIYAAAGPIRPPDYLTDKRMVALFEKEAAYMERVNRAAGVPVYGAEDVESLVVLVSSHFRYLYYLNREGKATDPAERQRFNGMKNKEAATHERFLRLLKLDPASRVDFGRGGGADGGDDDGFGGF